ncbi:TonB-dependent receptor domain-containing protein [Steroidobacter sp.]|uniref:TonB-dependent receptor domain-containing protein n=1 Tax=Steroidobacter sp. TaxID=1978227 RepID=UPI001A412D15|nr:TonB-dependent receptor [Steroidobacter sp.]MBL8271731.1 TonB-dependent receptor [Steroidobacter sp.]
MSVPRSGLALVACCAMLAVPPLVSAEPQATYEFVLPSQPLVDALRAIARQTGTNVLYNLRDLKGIDAPALRGQLTTVDAIERVLAGTRLQALQAAPTTVIVQPIDTERASDAAVSQTMETTSTTSEYPLRIAQAASTQQREPLRLAQASAPASGSETFEELEEVVVMSQKLARTIEQTSTSVAVFTSKDLERLPGLSSADDILSRIANVVNSGTNNLMPAVRGVDSTGPAQGRDAFLAGSRARLSIQVDGRPLGYNESSFGDSGLWDVQQVEVLRGPQSTLQGRNAVAGTVAIKTKDPTFDFQSGVRLIGGNFDARQGSVYISGPVVDDTLAFRVAYDYAERDSFLEVLPYAGVEEPQKFSWNSVRAKLLHKPASLPQLTNILTLAHSEYQAPQAETSSYPFSADVSANDPDPVFAPRTTNATLQTTWQHSDSLLFESTLAYSDWSVSRRTLPFFGNLTIEGTELVVEPRLRFGTADSRLQGLLGIFFYRADQDEVIDIAGGGTFDDRTTTSAAFAEFTYKLTDRFDVTFGGRFESEHRERHGQAFFRIDLDDTYDVFMPKLGLAYRLDNDVTIGAVVSRGYNGGGAALPDEAPFQSYAYDPEYVWTYEAYTRARVLDRRLLLTANVFFSDYKDYQLPFDLNPDPAVYSFIILNGEEVQTYGMELGARWQAATNLELFADVGVLKAEVTKYPGNSIEGNELARSPKFSGQAGIYYGGQTGVNVSFDAHYSGRYFSDITNFAGERVDAFWMANAQLGYGFGKWRVFGSVRNVFDERTPLLYFLGDPSPDTDAAVMSQPRTYRVGVSVDF